MRDEKHLKVALRYWRKRRGKSIEKLAREAHVSTSTIIKIENQGSMPRPDVLERLTEALAVSMEDLVVDETDEEKPAA